MKVTKFNKLAITEDGKQIAAHILSDSAEEVLLELDSVSIIGFVRNLMAVAVEAQRRDQSLAASSISPAEQPKEFQVWGTTDRAVQIALSLQNGLRLDYVLSPRAARQLSAGLAAAATACEQLPERPNH